MLKIISKKKLDYLLERDQEAEKVEDYRRTYQSYINGHTRDQEIIDNLKSDISKLNQELNAYSKVKGIVDAITQNGIKWFDYQKLSEDQQRFYFTAAQDALKNEAIKNEMNKMINDFAEWGLTKSIDLKEIEALRWQVSGMKLLMERLSDIHDPSIKELEVEEPHNAI